MMTLNKSRQEAEEIQRDKASEHPCLLECTALDLWRGREKSFHVETTLPDLDGLLGGGFHSMAITELCGSPGSGKTQLCQLVAASAIIRPPPVSTASTSRSMAPPSPTSSVLYIDTESALSPARLLEILVTRWPDLCTTEEDCCRLLDKIQVLRVDGEIALRKTMDQLEDLVNVYQPKLIILDSIASHFRRSTNLGKRSSQLARIAAQLKRLATQFNIAVVVTNQITGCIDRSDDQQNDAESSVTSALGNTWFHCVNTRIMLQRSSQDQNQRCLVVTKSPSSPRIALPYEINAAGLTMNGLPYFEETS